MDLKTKWQLRQFGLDCLGKFVSLTSFLIIVIAVRFWKLAAYGMTYFEGTQFPKNPSLQLILHTFLGESIYPVLIVIPLAIAIDAAIRQFILN